MAAVAEKGRTIAYTGGILLGLAVFTLVSLALPLSAALAAVGLPLLVAGLAMNLVGRITASRAGGDTYPTLSEEDYRILFGLPAHGEGKATAPREKVVLRGGNKG
ncbi:MAG: hypothetical protein HYU86_05835 [Chloroflexi bacterium]|nr:hypothetical protein [Chloroflexota bacterium]